MKTRFIPVIVSLIAGLGVCILNIVQKTEVLLGLKRLLVVLILFYIIGQIAKIVINRALLPQKEEAETETENEEVSAQQETSEDTKETTNVEEKKEIKDSSTNDKTSAK